MILQKCSGKTQKIKQIVTGILAAALMLAACGGLAESAAVTDAERISELEERLAGSEAARAALEAEKRELLTAAGGAAQKLTALEKELEATRKENEELLDQLTVALAELTGDEAQIDLLEQKVESTKELLEITREWLDAADFHLEQAAAQSEEEQVRKDEAEKAQAELANRAEALQAQLDAFRRVESASMPLGFTLPEDCGAAEVGGWLYVSRKDGTAQAVIRPFEGEDMTRDSLMEYLQSLLPQAPEASTVVRRFSFPGGELSRFAGSYTDEDGVEMYGVFCVAEIGEKFYCLETQAALENRAAASDLANQLTATLRARD